MGNMQQDNVKIEQSIREIASNLLKNKEVDLIIGYAKGTVPLSSSPTFITDEKDVDDLIWDNLCYVNLARYVVPPITEFIENENVPLKENIEDYVKREVLPYIPDAWVDQSWTRIGYQINFNRYFYRLIPSRALDEIENDMKETEEEIAQLLGEII